MYQNKRLYLSSESKLMEKGGRGGAVMVNQTRLEAAVAHGLRRGDFSTTTDPASSRNLASAGSRNPDTEHRAWATNSQPTRLSCNQQALREGPLLVDPLAITAEARARCHLRNLFGLILVRAFRPDGFVFVQHEPQAGRRNVYRLPLH